MHDFISNMTVTYVTKTHTHYVSYFFNSHIRRKTVTLKYVDLCMSYNSGFHKNTYMRHLYLNFCHETVTF